MLFNSYCGILILMNENINEPAETAIPPDPTSGIPPSSPKTIKRIIVLSLFILLGISAVVLSIYNYQKPIIKTVEYAPDNETPEVHEQNPQIDVLATLPPENLDILYNVSLDPYSKSSFYTVSSYQYTASSSSTFVLNGKTADTSYDNIHEFAVSPDGKRIAFIAERDDKQFVVLDNVEGKTYDGVKHLKFSADSRHIAYMAAEGKYFQPDSPYSGDYMAKTMLIVVDTSEHKRYQGTYIDTSPLTMYDPVFSKDGSKIAYTALLKNKEIIILDEQELAAYEGQKDPTFIGNTYDLAYLASKGEKKYLIVAGQEKAIDNYVLDSSGHYYFLGKDSTQIAYQLFDNNRFSLIINDTQYASSGAVGDLVFSNSGQYVAYYSGVYGSGDLFINGENVGKVIPNGATTMSNLLFSPDEKLLVYATNNRNEKNGEIHIRSTDTHQEIATLPLPGFRAIGLLKFSEDGAYIFFKGLQGRDIVYVRMELAPLLQGK